MNESEIQHQKIEKSLEFQYKNVRELLLHKTKANPNKTFLMVHGDETEEFTYLEFKNIVDKAVSFLLKNNLKKGDKISIIFHNSSDFLIIYFAGLCSGLTLIPINPDISKNEIEYEPKDKVNPYQLYQEGFEFFEKGNYFYAEKKFTEAELNFEIVEFAAKSAIMSSYSLYGVNFYSDALTNLDRYFISFSS